MRCGEVRWGEVRPTRKSSMLPLRSLGSMSSSRPWRPAIQAGGSEEFEESRDRFMVAWRRRLQVEGEEGEGGGEGGEGGEGRLIGRRRERRIIKILGSRREGRGEICFKLTLLEIKLCFDFSSSNARFHCVATIKTDAAFVQTY